MKNESKAFTYGDTTFVITHTISEYATSTSVADSQGFPGLLIVQNNATVRIPSHRFTGNFIPVLEELIAYHKAYVESTYKDLEESEKVHDRQNELRRLPSLDSDPL